MEDRTQNFSLSVNLDEANKNISSEDESHMDEGQLAVDVWENDTELIVLATMAGTPKEAVEIFLNNDLLTIRGQRKFPLPTGIHKHCSECYWGKFSRTIVLPTDIRADLTRAEYRYGLLAVILPKTSGDKNIPIFVVEE